MIETNGFGGLSEKEQGDLLAIAREIGWGAADILRSYYYADPRYDKDLSLNVQHPAEGPVTAADIAVNDYILENLQRQCGTQDFGYLSEETYKSDHIGQMLQPWVWVIDPLDGTRDFIERTGEFAVHMALVREHRPVLAVVAYPEMGKLYYATLGGGTFVETRARVSRRIQVSLRGRGTFAQEPDLSTLLLVVSRTHRSDRFNQLLQRLPYKTLRYVGSVGCKIVAIVEQQADVYISLSGKSAPKDWDFAAPELILTEAGGKFTHFDGSLLTYNTGDVSQWGCLMASNGHSHEMLCSQATEFLAKIDKAE